MDHRFQINLGGIIDLLSNHLYSGPEVYVRELLQNGVDAVRARRALEPSHRGSIELEILGRDVPTLLVVDDGIGLTEEEVHRFLATIGETSKRSDVFARRVDFLGQFGIGLLSCFLVSDEIVVITRSARTPDAPTIEWKGRPDGTYTLRRLERDVAPGTQVYVRARSGCESLLERERVAELAGHYGELLDTPITLTAGETRRRINDRPPPWRKDHGSPATLHQELLDYGEALLGKRYFDAVPMRTDDGALEGVAYVLPYRPSLAAQGSHRVYLKGMLVSESAKNLVPEWAFFVKCVVDAKDLRPNASREQLYEDVALAAARDALGGCLRRYLIELSQKDQARWRRFLLLHTLSIKALALQDDELYRLFIDHLPFETSLGEMTLADIRAKGAGLTYAPTVDEFRQIAGVAAAQGLCVVNGGYTYNTELLEKYSDLFPEVEVAALDPSEMARSFAELPASEREALAPFLELADDVLRTFGCRAELKRFQPATLPTLYTTDPEAAFRRSLERSREVSGAAWSDILGDLSGEADAGLAQLCFNHENALVRRVASQGDAALQRRCVQLLYVQALLLGHHPLNEREMRVLNDGLLGMIEWGLGLGP